MSSSLRFTDKHAPLFGRHWKFFLVWGALLAILGVCAISAAAFTTLISIVVLGFFIFASGIVIALDAFTYRRNDRQSFFLHLLLAVLYIVVGLLFIASPMNSSLYLTFWLGIMFIVIGAMRLIFGSAVRTPSWLWGVVNGFITLILGILILSSWPASSLFIIGIFVGVDLLFTGITYIMLAIAAHQFRKPLT